MTDIKEQIKEKRRELASLEKALKGKKDVSEMTLKEKEQYAACLYVLNSPRTVEEGHSNKELELNYSLSFRLLVSFSCQGSISLEYLFDCLKVDTSNFTPLEKMLYKSEPYIFEDALNDHFYDQLEKDEKELRKIERVYNDLNIRYHLPKEDIKNV